MKLTTATLRQIIKEELNNVLEAEDDSKTFEVRLKDAIEKNDGIKHVELGFHDGKSITRPDAEYVYMNNLLDNNSKNLDGLIDALKVKSIRFNDHTLIKVIDERFPRDRDYRFFKKLTPDSDKGSEEKIREVEKQFLKYLADNRISVSLF